MSDPHQLERIRDWVLGRLGPEERERFEAELESDRELAQLAEGYRDVHRWTEPAGVVPACHASLDELDRRVDQVVGAEPVRERGADFPWRRVAAAAGLLVAAGALYVTTPDAPVYDRPVELRTIPLTAGVDVDEPVLPATLASYRPVDQGNIQWVEDPDEAARLAAITGRPMLVYHRYRQCNVADEVEASSLHGDGMLALASECVPIIEALDDLDEKERAKILAGGYPVVELRGANGDVVTTCAGDPKAGGKGAFEQQLRSGLTGCSDAPPMPWQLTRDLGDLLERARACEARGELGEARRFYEEVVVASGRCGSLLQAGELGLRRVALAARDAIVAARESTEAGELDEAVAILTGALERFEGTPHAAELDQVLQVLRRTGSFPTIAWARDV